MKNATFRQLKTFETVARRLSFSRAAEELCLTQPAVSAQIKQLEEHVGLVLIEQLGKKLYLTPAGHEMLEQARGIIEQFRIAETAMARMRESAGGRLKVGLISAGSYFIPETIAAFSKSHAAVDLEMHVSNREEVLRQLDQNAIDLAIMIGGSQDTSHVNAAFAQHAFVLACSPTHPLLASASLSLQDLTKENFITRERGSDTRRVMDEVFAGKIESLANALEIASTETIKHAVMAGMGISFVSAQTITLELKAGLIDVLDVVDFPVVESWCVVHRRDKNLTTAAAAFKAFLLECGTAHSAPLSDPALT
ncbi:LysR family transcriptional regulator [Pararobbsia alpina]|uniref:LysR family transcriptional regulator n=1 Tax=Pararobbsia alpina TaxID=621374 RepID=UPI0039A433EE